MKSLLAVLPLTLINLSDIAPLNPDTVTVSGLSSGAAMSVQMLWSSSNTIQGAGVAAGVPYLCSQSQVSVAQACMQQPNSIAVSELVDHSIELDQQKLIDPLYKLKSARVFIFHGKSDRVVLPEAGLRTFEFARHFVPSAQIQTAFEIPAGHAMPVNSRTKQPCHANEAPWVNNCSYDGPGRILKHLLARELKASTRVRQNLHFINLFGFVDPTSHINASGLIYVPADCRIDHARKQKPCDLHVVFHGCGQTPGATGSEFIEQTSYNDWAEKNRLVIFYPSVMKSWKNPYACWDWWGYTGSDYYSRNAPQIRTLNRIIHKLTRESSQSQLRLHR